MKNLRSKINTGLFLAASLLFIQACGPAQFDNVDSLDKQNLAKETYPDPEDQPEQNQNVEPKMDMQQPVLEENVKTCNPGDSKTCNVQEPNLYDSVPTTYTKSEAEIIHNRTINHHQDTHRFIGSHHHHTDNHLYDIKHNYFPRVVNHPYSTSSQSATSRVNVSREVMPTTEVTEPIQVAQTVQVVPQVEVVQPMVNNSYIPNLISCPYSPEICARAFYRATLNFGY